MTPEAPKERPMYHPDPEIDAGVRADALEAELLDLSIGYPARWWVCPTCEDVHNRGFFLGAGQHRCLRCGYVGDGGTMHTNDPRPPDNRPRVVTHYSGPA